MVSDEETEFVGERGESCEPPQERGDEGRCGRCCGDTRGVRGSSRGVGSGVFCFGSGFGCSFTMGDSDFWVWRL